jgi:hypothetical protein
MRFPSSVPWSEESPLTSRKGRWYGGAGNRKRGFALGKERESLNKIGVVAHVVLTELS